MSIRPILAYFEFTVQRTSETKGLSRQTDSTHGQFSGLLSVLFDNLVLNFVVDMGNLFDIKAMLPMGVMCVNGSLLHQNCTSALKKSIECRVL